MSYKEKILEAESLSKRISITTIKRILSETNTKEEAITAIIYHLLPTLKAVELKEYKEINQDLIKLIDYKESKFRKPKK